MKDWKELSDKLLQNPEVKAEYDRLEPEFQLALQLIKARIAGNVTQAELARKAGVKQAYIARLESGDANPTVDSLNQVAAALNMRLKLARTV